jgi:LPXTG-site transpeptidase (sortase) family protein
VRRILRGFGWTMISLGAFTLYFLVYQLVGTNAVTGQAQAALGDELAKEWAAPASPNAGQGKLVKEKPVAEGKAFAKIKVPDIHVSQVLIEGTGRDDLRKGPGRISSGKMPGEPGTFAVSGHRTTYGAPFFNLDKLDTGDQIIIETRHATYVYKVTRKRIVAPTEVSVLDDVRGPNGKLKPTIVLTTCHPKFSARQRMIIFGDLVSAKPASRSTPA